MIAAIAKINTTPIATASVQTQRVRPTAEMVAVPSAVSAGKAAETSAKAPVGYGGNGQPVYPIQFYKPADCPWTA